MTEQEKISKSDRHDETESRLSAIIFALLCVILAFSVVAFGAVDLWASGVLSFCIGIIALLWLTDAWFKKEFQLSLNYLQIPIVGLIVIGIIQLLPLRSPEISSELLAVSPVSSFSIAPYSTQLAIVQLVLYLVFFAAALVFVNNHNRLQKIIWAIIIFASLMAFYGILQRLANLDAIYGLRPFNQAIPFASFVNQHHFAAFMEMTIGLSLGFLFSRATGNNLRLFFGIAIVVMGIALILTSSRGGMISLIAVIGFIVTANILQKPKSETDAPKKNAANYRRVFGLIGAGVCVVLILFGAVLLLGGDESLLRGIGLNNQEDISNGRIHFWQITWRVFLDYPILGAGFESFAFAFPKYDSWNGKFRVEQAHNDYLQILADAGIVGFVCVASFIFLLFKKGLNTITKTSDPFRRNAAVGALAGCTGILIHSFFDFPLRTPSNMLFFLMLTIVATASISAPKASRRRRKKRED